MPEERAPIATDQIEIRLEKLEEGQHQIIERLSRLEGGFEQMNQRIINLEQGQQQLRISLEQGQRWVLGLILGTWVTLAMGIVGLYFRG